MEKLPQDLIIDILSRLPTLSLLQSTRVCTSWHQIITTNPIFTTLRNNRSPISTDALILTCPNKLYFNQLIKPHSTPNIDLSSLLHGINTERFYLKVVGVCNGLICLFTFPKVMPQRHPGFIHMVNSFHIINPISKENLKLPKFHKSLKIGSTSKIKRMLYGFGFDKRNQVFKLVVFVFGFADNVNKLLLFTLGGVASRWRRVLGSVVPCMMRYAFGNASSVYVDGCLHWITSTTMPNTTDRTLVIMSFNLSDEAFGVIQTPELVVVVDHHSLNYRLVVLDNSLCWVDSESNNHINIWIKKGGESWTKSFCLQKSIVAPPSFGRVTPIKFEQNGRLFLQNRDCVACYNVQDNTACFFDVNYGDPQGNSHSNVFPFVGSFISINPH